MNVHGFVVIVSLDVRREEGEVWHVDSSSWLSSSLWRVRRHVCSNRNVVNEASSNHLLQSFDLLRRRWIKLLLVFQACESCDIRAEKICDLPSKLQNLFQNFEPNIASLAPCLCRFVWKFANYLKQLDCIR